MKIIVLNKKEQEVLTSLLIKTIVSETPPYELTTLLEKINSGAYEYAFNKITHNERKYKNV